MFPTQYAMNIMALATAFLVNPATFEDNKDRLIGIPAAYTMKINKPNSLPPVLGL